MSTTILSYPVVLEHFFRGELTSLYILTHVYIYLTDRKYIHSFHTVSVIFIGVSWNKYYLHLILFLIEFLCQLCLKLGCLDKLYSNVLCDHDGLSFGEQDNFTWKMEMKMSSIFSPVSIDAVNCGSVLMQVPHMM